MRSLQFADYAASIGWVKAFHQANQFDIDTSRFIYVVEQWDDGEEWYRKWSNGFCEQGGYTCDSSGIFRSNCSYVGRFKVKINLHVRFKNSDYCVFVAAESNYNSGNGNCGYDYVVPASKDTNGFQAICCYFTQTGMVNNGHYHRQYWEAKGYIDL